MVRGTGKVEKIRRSLTPSLGVPSGGVQEGVHATRRAGARHEVSKRVALKPLREPSSTIVLEGWALNVSRGGIRVILEDKVEPGDEFEVTLLDGAAGPSSDVPASSRVQRGCVVWVQEESDGVVAGIAFKDADAAPGDPSPPDNPEGG